ncbi:MAG: hypothetical protein HKN73_06030 [Gemmatimonadetes bacterium]|nr:hypothetical protein [Gemmatimonadota bacterium]
MAPSPAVEYRFGMAGALAPMVTFLAGVAWLGFAGAPDERGLWPVLLASLGVGLLLARDRDGYAQAALAGMARTIVMIMVMAWVLAGVFSAVLQASGLVHSLIWVGGQAGLGGGGFVVGAFLVAVLFSTATGTSLGTILVCAPLLYPASGLLEADPAWTIGAVLAGATFGDNVSPVSDTTIASASSQGAEMGKVVRTRLRYALPAAAVAVAVLFLAGGTGVTLERIAERVAGGAHPANLSGDPIALPMLLAPLLVFAALLRRRGLLESLFLGVTAAIVIALGFGLIAAGDLLYIDAQAFRARGLIVDGMDRAVGIVMFTLLLMAVLGGVEASGAVERLLHWSRARNQSARRTELRMFGLVSTAVLVTTHSVVAILAVGPAVRRLGEQQGIGPLRRANLLDTTVCTYPFLLPFFIPTVLAASATASGADFGLAPTSALAAGMRNPYSWALLGVILVAIVTGWGREDPRWGEEGTEISSKPPSPTDPETPPDERTLGA